VDVRAAHEHCLELFGARVAAVPADRWDDPTPCEDWDVRALVNHNVAENRWAVDLLAGRTVDEVGDAHRGDLLGDDPVYAYRESAERAREAAADDGVLERTTHLSFGDVPGAFYLTQRWIDLLVHAWDLSVSTGQDPDLPAELASAALEEMRAQEEAVRASGVFGPPVDVGPEADHLTRLVAFLGRDPEAWT
jgi:uncharacterized protein (TIGR03086 family)